MGCNLTFLSELKAKTQEMDKKILFLGLDNAGKTTLLFKLKEDEFKETVPTIGLNVEQIKYRNMTLTLWDVGGQARKLWKHYYDSVDAIIFVVDSADSARLGDVKKELLSINIEPGLESVPLLVLGNKQDVEEALSEDALGKELSVADMPKKEVAFQGCSAKSGEGVWEGIAKLADLMDLVAKGSLKS